MLISKYTKLKTGNINETDNNNISKNLNIDKNSTIYKIYNIKEKYLVLDNDINFNISIPISSFIIDFNETSKNNYKLYYNIINHLNIVYNEVNKIDIARNGDCFYNIFIIIYLIILQKVKIIVIFLDICYIDM